MRKILCLAIGLLLLSAAAAQAQSTIVVFDLQAVAAQSVALKVAKEALETKFGPQKAELEKERAAIEKKASDYAKKKPTDKQAQEFAKSQREYSEKAQAFMRIIQADEVRVRTDIDTVITAAAKSLAERQGYTMILDVAMVPYADPKLDVTNDMLTETNAVWKSMMASGQVPNTTAPAAAQ